MRILIIGAGATGGFYGGRLAHAGRDVTFLVRARRADELRRTGLTVVTPSESLTVAPQLISAAELAAATPFDLILVGVKAYAFESAVDDFAPAVGPGSVIVPMLNGMRHLDALDARFGGEHVLGGLCRIVGDMDAEGRAIQMTPLSDLAYGERSREVTPRIQAVDEILRGAGFNAVLSPDILAAMWVKWMLLSSLGSINALARGSIGAIRAVTEFENVGERFEIRVLEEAMAVAAANGYPPDAKSEAMMRQRLTEAGSTLESSMYRDLTRGNAVEVDQIVGDMIARGRACGVSTPMLEAAFLQLKLYEASRG